MPLAKSVPAPEVPSNSGLTEINSNPDQHFTYDGVPLDVAKHFGVDLFKADDKDKKQLGSTTRARMKLILCKWFGGLQ